MLSCYLLSNDRTSGLLFKWVTERAAADYKLRTGLGFCYMEPAIPILLWADISTEA